MQMAQVGILLIPLMWILNIELLRQKKRRVVKWVKRVHWEVWGQVECQTSKLHWEEWNVWDRERKRKASILTGISGMERHPSNSQVTQWTAWKGGQRKSKHGNEHLELIYLKASFSSHFLWHSRSWLAIKTTLWINYVPGMVYGLFNCTALHPVTLLIAQHFLQLGSPSSTDCMLLLSLFLLCF